MAAIIAHITRANRERIEKKRYEIIISKCMYEIKPFDKCFNAKRHNKYVAAKAMNVEVEDAQAFHQLFIDRLKELHREESEVVEFSWIAFFKELIFMLMSISLVPMVMLMVCLTWPLQEDVL